MPLPKQILVPIDFSPTSTFALEYAKTLVEELPASLHVIHVVEAPFLLNAEVTRLYREQLTEAAKAKLKTLLPAEVNGHLKATVKITSGVPFVEIINYAEQHEIDLIVIGTHGKGLIAQALLGGVADKVVRTAPCPVLTVRTTEPADETA